MKKLYVKRMETSEVVKEIEVPPSREWQIDKIMRGLLRNMNREDFFVDDSEFDERES